MAQFLLLGKVAEIVSFLSSGYFGSVNATFALLATCAILAYITNPFVRLLTEALKGNYLMWPIRNSMIAEQSRRYYGLVGRRIELGLVSSALSDSTAQSLTRKLNDALERGLACKCVTDKKAIATAIRAVKSVVAKRSRGELLTYSDLEIATNTLCVALSSNCSSVSDVVEVSGSNKNNLLQRLCNGLFLSSGKGIDLLGLRKVQIEAIKLDKARRTLIDTVNTAKRNADIYYTKALNSEQRQFSRNEIHPTVFGNSYAALSAYFDERFNIDLNFILPVLSIITSGDKIAGDVLATAQQQLDFAIRTFLFVIVFTVTWLIVATVVAQSIYVVPVLATAGLAATILMLEVVQASFRSFGEVIRAICILKRFDVLKALHVSLPETWEEEKILWENVNAQLQWGTDATVNYKHGDK